MTRSDWGQVATGWESHADPFRRNTMPVSLWMVDAIAPQPGHTVLDLAAGVGDTGFLAAELIVPGGTLITSDGSPEMLSAAQRRADELGIRNVRFRQIDLAQPIDVEAASIDGVLCRWGYMLLDDPEAALRDTRRIIRSGGRAALAAWTGPEDNPWTSLPSQVLVEQGALEPVAPGGPGQFAWAQDGVIAEQLENAGFVDYDVQPLDFTMRFASVQDWWATTRATSRRVHEAAADEARTIAGLREAAADWTQEDGSLAFPARTWVAAATG